ncbi:E3 ubiquitin-protein ligase RNF180 isoform X2 [Triplophysa rosa]|uniref:E3 ubiquitin-protein ligase RNF180 isoform X2 n=1 Tax=Triplophysa rosa TaxID=992332 RepID=UPI0025463A06|nr:E3 ubiquitin-protein ligase RNF180 isoform X2 [Triplophysa rosa]
MLRSSHQSSPCRRTSPPAQTPHDRTSTLSRRTRLEPLESNIIRGSQISPEDWPFNRRAHLMFLSSSEDEHEVGEQTGAATAELSVASSLLTPTPTRERRLSKRERRRLKSLRRRQKRRERSRQSQLHENEQSSTGDPSSCSEDEELPGRDREGYNCAVCLDVYFSPYKCHPCSHIFCEPCLRMLAKNCHTNTPCPLCRTTIKHVFFQKGIQRQASPTGRRQFPAGGYRLDAFNFEDDSHGWRFDMDMVIIYIYSANWVIGFIIFCLFCYFFFSSF